MNGQENRGYFIRVPLEMTQLTKRDGKVWPVAFDWRAANGDTVHVDIDKVLPNVLPCAEQRSGAVGDRYECEINGQLEYLYYSILTPRKWFKVVEVSVEEYNEYYKLLGGN